MTSPKLLVIIFFSFMALFIISYAKSFPPGRKLFQHQFPPELPQGYSSTPELPASYSQSRLSFSKSPMPRRSLVFFSNIGRIFFRKKNPGMGSGPTPLRPTPDLPPAYSATPKLPPPSYARSSKVPPPYNPTSELQPSYNPTPELPPSYTPSTELPPTYNPTPELPPSYTPTPELPPSYSASPSPAPY
uniref:Uncharacterized protein n=1 Tax=Noccaea caerulescens TaxID=107243 RepID=A0A1J3CVN2_NOCCA